MRRRRAGAMKAIFVVLFAAFVISCVLYYILHVDETHETRQPVRMGKNERIEYSEMFKKTTSSITQTTVSKKNELQKTNHVDEPHETTQPLRIRTYPQISKKATTRRTQTTVSKRSELQKTAILVIACNRPSVKRCLDALLKYKTSEMDFPIFVSQYCEHPETASVIASYDNKAKPIKLPHLPEIEVPPNMMQFRGYYKIARHYKLALGIVFNVMNYDNVIIVEDDLEIAPDFYEYFAATIPLLHKDPTLWCISAWNDNGKTGFVQGNDLLYRSDFFPGLGWALTRTLWKELEPKWPATFWDDWMRHPNQRHNRACIRPEIPRTITFGRIGVSNGQFFDQHLSKIQLNTVFFPFTKHAMSYMLKDDYDEHFKKEVYTSKLVSPNDVVQEKVDVAVVRVEYNSNREFISLAKQFGLMDDLKAGVPRMAYLGIVSFMSGKYRVYLAPPMTWTSYTDEQ